MEDYKLRDLRASHTLGWFSNNVDFFFRLAVGRGKSLDKFKIVYPSSIIFGLAEVSR